MKKILNTKLIIFGVIILFLALVFTPLTESRNVNDKVLEVEATDYLSDGSKITKIIELTKTEINEIKNKILNTVDLTEQLQILKEYGLLENDITEKVLEDGVKDRANQLGISSKQARVIPRIGAPIQVGILNKVTSVQMGGLSLRLGITPIIKLIEVILKMDLPRVDLIDITGGILNIVVSEGLIYQKASVDLFGLTGMIGFVGTGVKVPGLLHIFVGYSALMIHFSLIGFKVKRMINIEPTVV